MYLKNQIFSDAEALEEALFDFELGSASPALQQLQHDVAGAMREDPVYQQEKAAQPSEEDRDAFEDEEKFRRLTEKLMTLYGSFEIRSQKLYGIREGQRELLAEIDLV